MAVKELAVHLVGKDMGTLNLLTKAGDESEKAASKADRLGAGFQKAGTVMMGAGAAMLAGFYKAGQAAEEANKAHLKLDNTLANAPQLAGANKQAFLDQASALQKVTVADDEAVIGIQALLGQFGLAQSEITDLTPLVVDLAQKMGVDFDTAAKMVGKSVEGSAGALKKAGIEVDATAFATDHYGATVDALRKTVGGFAEQEGKTFSGQMKIMENQLHDIEEGVGVGVTAAFSKLLEPVQSLSHAFTELSPETQSTVGSLGTYASVGLIAAGATSSLIGVVIKARENFASAASGVASMARGLGTVDGAIRGVSFAAATAGVVAFTYQLHKNRDEAQKWAAATTGGGEGTIPEQIERTKKSLKEGEDALRNYASLDFGDTLHLFGSNEGTAQADKVQALKDQLSALEGQQKGNANATELQKRGLDEFGRATDGLTAAEDKNTDAVKKQKDEYERAMSSLRAFFDEAAGRVDTERALAQAHDDLSRSIASNGIHFDNMTQQGRDNRKAFEDAGRAAVDWGVSQIEAGASADAATFGVNLQIESLRKQMYAAGFSKVAVDNYITSLKLTPTDVSTAFHAPGLMDVWYYTVDLGNRLNDIGKKFPAAQAGVNAVLHRNKPIGAASGGAFKAKPGGHFVNVAEGGEDEVVAPQRMIAEAVAQGGGGGGVSVVVNVAGSVIAERDLVEAVRNGVITDLRRTGGTPTTYFGG